MKKQKQNQLMSQLEKLELSRVSVLKHCGYWLTNIKYLAIKQQPEQENLIELVCRKCVLLIFLFKKSMTARKRIICMLGSFPKNKRMILNDKFFISKIQDPNILTMNLLLILLRELILKEKAYKPYWTTAFKNLSEQLSSPIKIDLQDSDMILSNTSLLKQAGNLSFLTLTKIQLPKQKSQMTLCPLSTCSAVNKWEKENINKEIQPRTRLVHLPVNDQQRKILLDWFYTSNYIYNKTVNLIEVHKHPIDRTTLRDKLVTENSQKSNKDYNEEYNKINIEISQLNEQLKRLIVQSNEELKNNIELKLKKLKERKKAIPSVKNESLKKWELNTPKETRANAVFDVCDAYNSAFSRMKIGQITHFRMEYRKKKELKSIALLPKQIKLLNNNSKFKIMPKYFKKQKCSPEFKLSKRTIKSIQNYIIHSTVRLFYKDSRFYIGLLDKKVLKNKKNDEKESNETILCDENAKKTNLSYCGIDPGSRDFLTVFNSDNTCWQLKHNNIKLKQLDGKIENFKKKKRRIRIKRLDIKIEFLRKKRKFFEKHRNNTKLEQIDSKIEYLKKRISSKKYQRPNHNKRRNLLKIERKKSNLIKEMHIKAARIIVKSNDVIFYGDIKSHGIVKNNPNKYLNIDFNNLKFYKFKMILLQQAEKAKKIVIPVNEYLTTKTCSTCGTLNDPGKSKTYNCSNCNSIVDRDINAAKNILMKGILV